MKTRKTIVLSMIVLFVFLAFPIGDMFNAAAAPLGQKMGTLTINNKIGGRIYISFTGPKNYSFYVEDGKNVKEMEQGEYTYSYYADGDTIEGMIKVKSSASLVLKLVRGKLTLNNMIGGSIYLSLSGPRDYGFWVPQGKSVQELVPGTYSYSYYAEGGTDVGSFTLKKSGSVFVLKIDKGKLKIQSKYAQNVFITFSGPVSYTLWATPGKSTLEMRVGTYKYEYWSDGKKHSGSVTISKKGSSLILEPPKVCACNKNIYNCSDFSYQSQAQACFSYCMGQVGKDIHRLDGDHDGWACEALP